MTDAPETPAPKNDDRAREVLLAGPAAILMVILVAIIAVIATEDSNSTKVVAIRVERKEPATVTTTTTIPLPTTTTTAPLLTTTTSAPPVTTTTTAVPAAPPSSEPPYVAPPLPPGTNTTINSCTWSNGSLRASGTATNNTGEDDSFFVTVVWVSQGVEVDEDFDLFDIANGQSVPWSLSTEADRPTAPFSCSVEIE